MADNRKTQIIVAAIGGGAVVVAAAISLMESDGIDPVPTQQECTGNDCTQIGIVNGNVTIGKDDKQDGGKE